MNHRRVALFIVLTFFLPAFPQARTAVVKISDGDLVADTIPDTSGRLRSAPEPAVKPAAIAETIATANRPAEKILPFKIGISAGLGYNQFFWIEHNTAVHNCYRTAFALTPDFRVNLHLHYKQKISLMPFVEYNIFGGKSAEDSTGYKDEYWFYALGTGIDVIMHFSRFEAGIGAKINFIVKTVSYSYIDTGSNGHAWDKTDWTNDLVRVSADLGIRIGYSMGRCTLSNEEWFGITDLLHRSAFQAYKSLALEWASAYEIHYRLLLTFSFPK